MKCWYCGERIDYGSIHMYQCAEKIVKYNKKKEFENALLESLEVECPAQDCDYVMKGDFVDIVIESEKHFKKYHDNE